MSPSDPKIAEQHLTQTAWVHGLARALVRDVHLAEDAAQEACLAALARADRGESSWDWLDRNEDGTLDAADFPDDGGVRRNFSVKFMLSKYF